MKGFSIRLPENILFCGINCGIKGNNKKDLGLVFFKEDFICTLCITKNNIKAPAVRISAENQKKTNIKRGIVVLSGAAAAISERSKKKLENLLFTVAKILNIKPSQLIVATTGPVTKDIPPIDEYIIKTAVDKLSNTPESLIDFAEAITTTDKRIKIKERGELFAIAKGAGMIYPNLATTLSFFFCKKRPAIENNKKIFLSALEKSLNRICVDGCCSTNDLSCFFFPKEANIITQEEFKKDLDSICQDIAIEILKDAEGANKICKIQIERAKSLYQAKIIAQSIANSPLFKAALYGGYINIGRVLQSAGQVAKIKLNKLKIFLDKKQIYKNQDEFLENQKVGDFSTLRIVINQGSENFFIFTTDLSPEYVRLNCKFEK